MVVPEVITIKLHILCDIVERLKELTVSDYSETLVDKDNDDPLLLFVFGKDINNKLVYIKLKIKESILKKCCAYHFIMPNMIWNFLTDNLH